jgi:tRNA threonylcarbamoyladenosine biosynthesis protein TsaE
LEYLGIEDLLEKEALLLIEWPEKGEGVLPQADLKIHILYREEARGLRFSAGSERGMKCLSQMEKVLAKL